MTRLLLKMIYYALLSVMIVFAIIALVGLSKISSDTDGSGALILLALIFMIPVGLAMYAVSQKLKSSASTDGVQAVNDISKEALNNEALLYKASLLHKKIKPEFEIKYNSSSGEVSVRKILVLGLNGSSLDTFCFLRNEERSFYIPGIKECVDLSTGELINENLMVFFTKLLFPRKKLSRVFEYEDWCWIPYVEIPEDLPEDLCFFKLGRTLHARIVTYKDGAIEGDFYFGKILDSHYETDQYYVEVKKPNGDMVNVGFSKILSVENRNFVEYLLEEFNKSKSAEK